jgi:hypothetical protein
MLTNTLHILNGQEMYNHYKRTEFLDPQWMIPFNEAMCDGGTCSDIFSEEFIRIRTEVHQVTREQYERITLEPLRTLLEEPFSELVLWFDSDMFCQINLLTLLGWLDQTNYRGAVTLHLVGDRFERIAAFSLEAQGYHSIYQQVLIKKEAPEHIHPAPLKKGVELYLNHLDPSSDLMVFIRERLAMPNEELVRLLLDSFKAYGLGDVQYEKIIRKCRGPK